MLLTIPPKSATDFGGRHTDDFHFRDPIPALRYSPRTKHDSPVTTLQGSIADRNHYDQNRHIMSTPHRGLPPPAAMSLPDPARQSGPMLNQSLGAMPAPPNQWHGQEDSMRNWLSAKAEEDKRKQEEEKTRQETLRLEQRRIEQSMLRESLQGGVPPQMVPMIYAGIGGANLANVSLDWLSQYSAQLQAAQQQQVQQTSPETKRDTRMLGQGQPQFTAPQAQPQAPQAQPPGPLQTTFSAYPTGPGSPGGKGRQVSNSTPRSAPNKGLPRLTTNEMYVQQPPQAAAGAHPLQQSQTMQQESSPSIYFHHWVPPNETKSNSGGKQSSKDEAPSSAHPGSQRSDDYRESPRKRKAQGGHQSNPPPSSAGPQYTSPSFSTISSSSGRPKNHARSRSNPSAEKDEGAARPGNRRDGREGQEERRVREMSNQHFERPGPPYAEAERGGQRENERR